MYVSFKFKLDFSENKYLQKKLSNNNKLFLLECSTLAQELKIRNVTGGSDHHKNASIFSECH